MLTPQAAATPGAAEPKAGRSKAKATKPVEVEVAEQPVDVEAEVNKALAAFGGGG